MYKRGLIVLLFSIYFAYTKYIPNSDSLNCRICCHYLRLERSTAVNEDLRNASAIIYKAHVVACSPVYCIY